MGDWVSSTSEVNTVPPGKVVVSTVSAGSSDVVVMTEPSERVLVITT